TYFFILNISFGLIGLIGLLSFKASFQSSINERSKSILGADIAIYNRVAITEEKKKEIEKLLPKPFIKVQRLSMFSMLKAAERTRLINVRTAPEGFPFYGEFEFEIKHSDAIEGNQFKKGQTVWVYPEIMTQMGLSIGDSITLGHANFIIANIITNDSQQTFQMGAMVPKVFMSPLGEKRARLYQKGSTAFHGLFYKLPKKDFDLKALREKVENIFTEVGPEVVTPEKSGEQVGLFMQYLSDFLGLVSLVALFLSSVGLFYLFRSFIAKKKKEIAIYIALGRKKKDIRRYFITYLLTLGTLGTLVGVIVGNALYISISNIATQLFAFKINFILDTEFTILSFLVGVIGTFLIGFPLLKKALNSGANELFQEDIRTINLTLGFGWFIPWLVFYWMIGIIISHSIKIGSLFFGLFFFQAILGIVVLLPMLKLAEKYSDRFNLTTKHALLYLSRHKASSVSAFLAIAQGVLLLTLIPQVRSGLQQELSDVDGAKVPTLFLFDIQEEQVTPLQNFFYKNDIPFRGVTPMVRGRITKINDEEFKRPEGKALTREEEREFRFRNRGTNLSYRGYLHDSETIIEGSPFNGKWTADSGRLPELSIETRYAKRVGIELGDKVSFEVLGMPIDAKVVNIRKVKWTSFYPNFFVMFQPGVLDDAPKTFLGVSGELNTSLKDEVQIKIFDLFPNVSVIDITRVVERILIVLKQMSIAMGAMALLSLIAGLFVLYSLINHQLTERQNDIGFFKIMGFSKLQLQQMTIKEFVIITIAASLFGSLGSIIITFLLAKVLFDGLWLPSLHLPLMTTISLSLIVTLLSWLSAKSTFCKKTVDLIQLF
ncbi:MAG: FtsX-like permease family protein, partial [Bacteriovoracaceae bacterium]|nr:FtsX-like permease family protein [Bacteriovoracaceae bacterium]